MVHPLLGWALVEKDRLRSRLQRQQASVRRQQGILRENDVVY